MAGHPLPGVDAMIVERAAERFRAGDYVEAHRLYEEAAARYGVQLFAYNLEVCRRALGLAESTARPTEARAGEGLNLLLSSRHNLSRWPEAYLDGECGQYGALRVYYWSSDGLRPLHDRALLERLPGQLLPPPPNLLIPAPGPVLTLAPASCVLPEHLATWSPRPDSEMPGPDNPLVSYAARPACHLPGRVSVIIPTCRRPINLHHAIVSVLTQDYPDMEVIVVDDSGQGSGWYDQTVTLVDGLQRQYPAKRLKLVGHRCNRNGAAARNTGLLQATGEYLCFLDDDDIYLPGRIADGVAALAAAPAEVAAVYCGYRGWNSDGNDPDRYRPGDLTREILLLDYERHYLHTNTATYRTAAVLALGGFDESYRRHQDLEFNLRFLAQHRLGVVPACQVELSPRPSAYSNKAVALDLARLKLKFLERFRTTITRFDAATVSAIHLKHLGEIAGRFEKGV